MECQDLVESKKLVHENSWQSGYQHFSRIIRQFNCKKGAEIGVAFGGHVEAILNQTQVETLYGIDSYKHRDNYADPMNLPQDDFDILYLRTKERLSHFGNRFIQIRSDSKYAVDEIEGLIDFVYIDADHSYKGVWDDLCTWYQKVKVGGIIGGHDYNHSFFPGVTQAIDEFFRRFGWEVHYEGEHIWWVEKQHINISFFIPAYNCENTIQESVESIIESNFTIGDELVIVNDCSTDNTKEVLDKLREKYVDIRILKHSKNKGGAAARNTAIENCNHPVLFCLDSDNVLEAGSVSRLKEFLENIGADVASFQELHYFQKEKRTDFKWVFKPELLTIHDYLSTTKVPSASGNYMFTKESWIRACGYPEFAGALDTWGFGIRQVMTGSKMYVMPDSFYYHRYGHESYWMRDAEKRKGSVSLRAIQMLIPFFDLIDERDLDYIMSRRGRYTWLSNLDKRPIRLASGKKKQAAWESNAQKGSSAFTLAKIIMKSLKPSLKKLLVNLNLLQFYRRLMNYANYASPIEVERTEQIFYINFLREGMTVFDIGANVGEISLLFSRFVGSTGKVHSFEASSSMFEKLTKVCQLANRPQIVLNHNAVADKEGRLKLHVYDEHYSGWNSLANRPLQNYGIDVKPTHIEEVEAVTIDEYCKENNISQIDLLKIDVEGAEFQVLLGARQMLENQNIRCCVFEFGQTTFDTGNHPNEIEGYLKQVGYKIRNVVKGEPVFPGRSSAAEARFSMQIATPRV